MFIKNTNFDDGIIIKPFRFYDLDGKLKNNKNASHQTLNRGSNHTRTANHNQISYQTRGSSTRHEYRDNRNAESASPPPPPRYNSNQHTQQQQQPALPQEQQQGQQHYTQLQKQPAQLQQPSYNTQLQLQQQQGQQQQQQPQPTYNTQIHSNAYLPTTHTVPLASHHPAPVNYQPTCTRPQFDTYDHTNLHSYSQPGATDC